MSLTEAVQAALVTALRADTALAALIGDRVFDDVLPDAPHPYVSLGPEDWRPIDSDDGCVAGDDGVVQIDIWSRAPGRVECKRITDRVARILQDAALPLAAPYSTVSCRVILKRVLQDSGALARHGVVQVELMTDDGTDDD